MEYWKEQTLGDCVSLQSGGTPSKKEPEYWDGEIPWLSPKDMNGPRVNDTEDHITKEGAENGTQLVPPGTILIMVRGMGLANHFPVCVTQRQMAFNQDVKAVTPDDSLRTDYLAYWLRAQEGTMMQIADEAAHGTKRIQTDRFLSFPIKLPPKEEQKKIAGILSTFDDLIENNKLRAENLEQTAQLYYEEWFEKFRFPGHESCEFKNSPLGEIPKEWGVQKLPETVKIYRRGTQPTYAEDGPTVVINQKCIRDYRLSFDDARRREDEFDEVLFLEKGDVLVNSTGVGTLGRVTQNLEELPQTTVDSHVTIIRPLDMFDKHFYGLQMFQNQALFEHLGTGSTGQTELTKKALSTMDVLVPPQSVMEMFGEFVAPIRELAVQLLRRNENIREIRDHLLPQLVFGEIDLPRQDIGIEVNP